MAQGDRPGYVSRFLAHGKEVSSGLLSQEEETETNQQRRRHGSQRRLQRSLKKILSSRGNGNSRARLARSHQLKRLISPPSTGRLFRSHVL
jgi:hypothetical protein